MKCFSFLSASVFIMMLFTIVGCNKASYSNTGIITGYDHRTGACYGGLFMNFVNSSVTDTAYSYIIRNSPSSIGLDSSNIHFPVTIQINWTYTNQATCPQDITISSYAY